MNNDQFKGQWNQFKGKIKEKWGKLTDDDMRQIDGKRDQLIGKLQSRYGYEKQRAEDELCRWEQSCGCSEEMEWSGAASGVKPCHGKAPNGSFKNPAAPAGSERNMRGGQGYQEHPKR